MSESLVLIVIGDNNVRDDIYNSFSHSAPVHESDTILSSNEAHAIFILRDKQVEYDIHKYTNDVRSLTSSGNETSQVLLKEYLTVVVCIDEDENETTLKANRFDFSIEQLRRIRGNKGFNIIPIISKHFPDHKPASYNRNIIDLHLSNTYPLLYRNALIIDKNDLENQKITPHLDVILDVTLATPVYNEIRNCIQLVHTLETQLAGIPPIKFVGSGCQRDYCPPDGLSEPIQATGILAILKQSLNIIGSSDCITKEAVKAYLNRRRVQLSNEFEKLKDELNNIGVRDQTYAFNIFLNILCSIAAIFVSLTIVGFLPVCYVLYQNSKYHNNCLKFFPTNNIDSERANIVKVEDEVTHTLLRAR